MDPYQGASITLDELGLRGSVVDKLVSALPPRQYCLFFDNFFTSFKLLETIFQKNIKTGTIRFNRVENCPSNAC